MAIKNMKGCFQLCFFTLIKEILLIPLYTVHCDCHWWKVTEFIHLSTVLKYNFGVHVLYLSVFTFSFLLLLHYNSEGNITLFTPRVI